MKKLQLLVPMLYLVMAVGCATVYHDTEPVSNDYVFEEKADTAWVAVSLARTEAYCSIDISGILYSGPMGGGILNLRGTSADARSSEEKDKHQTLVVFEAKPGRYRIVGLKHLWKGEIWLDNQIYFDVSPGKVNYIGHLKESCCMQNGAVFYSLFRENASKDDLALIHRLYPQIDENSILRKIAWTRNRTLRKFLTPEDCLSIVDRQPALLDEQKSGLLGERPGKIDIYFVGFAGFSDQDVFEKEILYTRQLFDERFDTLNRSAVLVNHKETSDALPMATASNLSSMLQHIGGLINPEEDLVFIYMTSHGLSSDYFLVEFSPFLYTAISPEDLKAMISRAGIKWKVIVVSACFSGGFIDALKDENTLVMTASAYDKTSFGCSSFHDFTYFGRAFYKNQLGREGFCAHEKSGCSWIDAFQKARQEISEWEKDGGIPPSEPQIFCSDAMRKKLEEIEAQFLEQ